MKRIKEDTRGISTIIATALGLVIVVVIVANIVLWNYEMNQLDWEKVKENIAIVSVTSINQTSLYNPSDYSLGGTSNWVSGSVSDLTTDDAVYMIFRSYSSATDASDFVDNDTSNLDSSSDKGTHSDFSAQQYGPDSIYDTLTEADSENITYEISAESYSATNQTAHSFDFSLQKGSGNARLVVVTVSWEDAQASASVSSMTFDGTPMTRIVNVTVGSGYSEHISLWYLLDSSLPSSSGNYNIAVTVSENITREIYLAVAEYSRVKQSAPDDFNIDANTSAGNTAITLTAAANGSLAVAGVGEGGINALTNTNNITNLQEQVLISSGSALGHRTNVSAGNITVGWNNLGTREGMVGAVWQPSNTNYELDLEVQWTSADFNETNEELCIYAGPVDAEDIRVDVWNTTTIMWDNVFTDLTPNAWNNLSVSSWLTGSTFTIRFRGSAETNDPTRDNWGIDIALLHVWSNKYTLEVEFTGSSNIEDWAQLNWIVNSAWTISSVNVTLQLYDYELGSYSTSGNGYMVYTSDGTPNTDEHKSQTISVNPTRFANTTGYWKIKVKGVKVTATQFDFKADWIEFEVVPSGTLFTFENEGSSTIHLVSLWVNNSTHHQRYGINIFINSGETETYIRSDISLPSKPYTIKVVTERGNIATSAFS